MSHALKITDLSDPTDAASLVATRRAVPYGLRWLDLATAEKRSGIPLRTLRRRCVVEWLSQGKAELRTLRGSKRAWFVREDADPELMPVKYPEQMAFDLSALTAAQRASVDQKKLILDEWWEARSAGRSEALATSRYVAILSRRDGLQPSRSTLFEWERNYRDRGLAGLIDGRSNNSHGDAANDPFLMEVQRLYLKPKKLSMKTCWSIACELFEAAGQPTRSYKTAQRFLNKLPEAARIRWREGDSAFVAKAEPFIERDYTTLASNETWCGDHHRLDLFVIANGKHVRPWLTAWMDMRSRKIVGFHIFAGDPNTETIIAAFADGARTNALPLNVYVDNGKDFDSYALNGRTKSQRRAGVSIDRNHAAGVFARFGIKANFAWAYHGQSKPIERFFGTLADAVKIHDTACGNSPATRPDNLPANIKAGKALKLDEFREWITAWIDGYNNRAHSGQGMDGKSPAVVFNENLRERRECVAELLDTLAMKHTKPVKVTRNGVRYNKLTYGWNERTLHDLLGKEVTLLVDPKRIDYVIVTTLEGRLICKAGVNERISANATSEDLKAAIATKKKHRKALADYHTHRPRMADDLPTLVLENMRRNAQAAAPADAASTVVRTPLDADSKAFQEAFNPPMKMAIGSELGRDPLREWSDRRDAREAAERAIREAEFRPLSMLEVGRRLREAQEADRDAAELAEIAERTSLESLRAALADGGFND